MATVEYRGAPTNESIGSLADTESIEPWGYYEQLRELGDVVWDTKMNAWIISSYDLVREFSRKDEEVFERTYVVREGRGHMGMTAEEWQFFVGGGSNQSQMALMTGDEHERHHRWWMRAFSPRVLSKWRETMFRPICHEEIDKFAADGRADLSKQYAERITPRVMASFLGLPHGDDEWIAHLVDLFELRVNLRQRHSLGADVDPELRKRGIAATQELSDLVMPYVRERKDDHGGDDFISLVWRGADELFAHPYSEIDVASVVVGAWGSGAGSVARGVGNALYLLLKRPDLHDQIQADEEAMKAFVEESLRLYGPVSWNPRYAKADIELGGVHIKEGDLVLGLSLAANRDERRYPGAADASLGRPSPRDHFSFFAGPRTCPGQGLARVELDIFLAVLLERLPDVHLDPDAEQPHLIGVLTRSWEPLNVRFTPA